jgi:hypothetical protein
MHLFGHNQGDAFGKEDFRRHAAKTQQSFSRILLTDDELPTVKHHSNKTSHTTAKNTQNDDDNRAQVTDDNHEGDGNSSIQKPGHSSPLAPASAPSTSTAARPSTNASQLSSSSKKQCHSLSCRAFHAVSSPYAVAGLAIVLLCYYFVRRRSRRTPSHGAYRAVTAQYVSSAFDDTLSRDDYLSEEEYEEEDNNEYWAQGGRKSVELGTFKDDLTLDEVNG